MYVSDRQIEEIRNSSDIVEIISDFVDLKKSGRNYKGLCPFHKEKSPSFMVNPEKQIYHCFGCGSGGDVISFVSNYQKVNFVEALQYLAEKARIPLSAAAKGTGASKTGKLYEVTKVAADVYRNALWTGNIGGIAQDYLQKRGINREMSDTFHLGYAPESWDFLLKQVSAKKEYANLLPDCGLFVERELTGGYYDRFRNRLVFPILDLSGRIVGFGGRVLDQGEPKYINSPETPVYRKSSVLYGLYQARSTLREKGEGILVEGYMDCIALHQYGITNALASSGTAFTERQAKLLARFCRRVYLVFDGDEAGMNAAMRSGPFFLQEGLETRIVILPETHDPDSFIRAHGTEEFRHVLQSSSDIVDHHLLLIAEDFHGATFYEQSRMLEPLLELVLKIPDEFVKREYIKKISRTLGTDLPSHDRLRGRRRRRAPSPDEESCTSDSQKEGGVEYEMMRIMLQKPETIARILEYISEDMFGYTRLTELFRLIIREYGIREDVDVTTILQKIEDPDIRNTVTCSVLDERRNGLTEEWIRDCTKMLHRKVLDTMMGRVKKDLKSIERKPEDDQKELLQMYEDLARKRASLDSLYLDFCVVDTNPAEDE
jgi:DNA primase